MKRELAGWIVAGVLAIALTATIATVAQKETDPPLTTGVVWHESAEDGVAFMNFDRWLNDGENDPHSQNRRMPNGYTVAPPNMGDPVLILGERENGLVSVRFEAGPRAGKVMDWPRRWVKEVK
jgi:hypothetical protein